MNAEQRGEQEPIEAEPAPVLGYVRTAWDCPACGEVNDAEGDATGETIECSACPQVVAIQEVR